MTRGRKGEGKKREEDKTRGVVYKASWIGELCSYDIKISAQPADDRTCEWMNMCLKCA